MHQVVEQFLRGERKLRSTLLYIVQAFIERTVSGYYDGHRQSLYQVVNNSFLLKLTMQLGPGLSLKKTAEKYINTK